MVVIPNKPLKNKRWVRIKMNRTNSWSENSEIPKPISANSETQAETA